MHFLGSNSMLGDAGRLATLSLPQVSASKEGSEAEWAAVPARPDFARPPAPAKPQSAREASSANSLEGEVRRVASAIGLGGFRYFGFEPPSFAGPAPPNLELKAAEEALAPPSKNAPPPPTIAETPPWAAAPPPEVTIPAPPEPPIASGFPLLAELTGAQPELALPPVRQSIRRPGAYAALHKLRPKQDS